MPLGEGWYVDLTTGQAIQVYEHAHDVMQNPQKFRVNPKEIAGLQPTVPADRDKIRRLVLHRGFARVRAHGASVVVEFDVKVEDAVPVVIPFLTETFGPNTWVAFHDITSHKQYTDIQVSDLEDQDKLNQVLGLVYEHKGIKLSRLYEDYDITPVGSRKYATGTEKLVRGPKSGAGAGVHPPEAGDLSRISDVGSEPYTKDTVKPSEKPRASKRPSVRRPLG
jgi:hypothetical protein